MPDTNIIISALMFPDSKPAEVLTRIASRHEMVLSSYLINEVESVLRLKYPKLLPAAQELFSTMSFELAVESDQADVVIADPKDQPILDAAVSGEADVIVSGDKHFKNLDIKRPKVMSPSEFLVLE
ncbi:MAG: putative toxin-antitoxin system toxin component, PIN family [Coriobacteriia bacterium]|nr:putative toxin-antitoxin system toxin component, PIN family [Coriobacteriia bacterium]